MAGRRFVYDKELGKVVEVGLEPTNALNKPIISDALGFTEHQFQDFETDRVKNGHTGVEFIRDKDVPQFFQVKCSSPEAWSRYLKHRGMADRNSKNGSGARITQAELDKAEQQMLERYPRA